MANSRRTPGGQQRPQLDYYEYKRQREERLRRRAEAEGRVWEPPVDPRYADKAAAPQENAAEVYAPETPDAQKDAPESAVKNALGMIGGWGAKRKNVVTRTAPQNDEDYEDEYGEEYEEPYEPAEEAVTEKEKEPFDEPAADEAVETAAEGISEGTAEETAEDVAEAEYADFVPVEEMPGDAAEDIAGSDGYEAEYGEYSEEDYAEYGDDEQEGTDDNPFASLLRVAKKAGSLFGSLKDRIAHKDAGEEAEYDDYADGEYADKAYMEPEEGYEQSEEETTNDLNAEEAVDAQDLDADAADVAAEEIPQEDAELFGDDADWDYEDEDEAPGAGIGAKLRGILSGLRFGRRKEPADEGEYAEETNGDVNIVAGEYDEPQAEEIAEEIAGETTEIMAENTAESEAEEIAEDAYAEDELPEDGGEDGEYAGHEEDEEEEPKAGLGAKIMSLISGFRFGRKAAPADEEYGEDEYETADDLPENADEPLNNTAAADMPAAKEESVMNEQENRQPNLSEQLAKELDSAPVLSRRERRALAAQKAAEQEALLQASIIEQPIEETPAETAPVAGAPVAEVIAEPAAEEPAEAIETIKATEEAAAAVLPALDDVDEPTKQFPPVSIREAIPAEDEEDEDEEEEEVRKPVRRGLFGLRKKTVVEEDEDDEDMDEDDYDDEDEDDEEIIPARKRRSRYDDEDEEDEDLDDEDYDEDEDDEEIIPARKRRSRYDDEEDDDYDDEDEDDYDDEDEGYDDFDDDDDDDYDRHTGLGWGLLRFLRGLLILMIIGALLVLGLREAEKRGILSLDAVRAIEYGGVTETLFPAPDAQDELPILDETSGETETADETLTGETEEETTGETSEETAEGEGSVG